MAVKCPNCGSENVEKARFCERCGRDFWAPVYPPSVVPATKKASRSVIAMIAIGIFVFGLGALLYVLAMADVFAQFDDPNVDPSEVEGEVGVITAAYVLMGIGVLMFFVGLLLLVLKSD